MDFYNRFLELCASVNKKPSRVALDMGLSKAMVSNWKTRGTSPTDATLQKIADYFGVAVDSLVFKETKKPATVSGDEPDDVTREILSILSELTPEELALARARILKIKESR